MLERVERERVAMMMIAGGMLLALSFSYATTPEKRVNPTMTMDKKSMQDSRPGELSAEAIGRCRRAVVTAFREGLIRERPSPDRIAVDETLWSGLAQPARNRLMQAVSCDRWKTAAPPLGERVTAYGWTSHRRLATLSGIRPALP